MRWLLVVVVAGALLVVVPSRSAPVRTVAVTAFLVPQLLGVELPFEGPEPRVDTVRYGVPNDRMDIWVPVGATPARRLPAVVLALGVHPQPIDHPDIVRVAKAISRVGVVVAIPDSSALRALRVTPAEPGHLAEAILIVARRPDVDPARVGLAGFSAGASIAMLAAGDPRIRENLRFVSAFGGYASAETLLVDVATRTTLRAGEVAPWLPDSGIRRDILELMLVALGRTPEVDRLRAVLTPIVAADEPPRGLDPDVAATFEDDLHETYRLFTADTRAVAANAVARLSPALRQQLSGISPLAMHERVAAPVFLLHGATDTAIPVEHADTLASTLGGRVIRYTRFGTYGHEQPGAGGLDPSDAADIFELSLYLRDIVAATTE